MSLFAVCLALFFSANWYIVPIKKPPRDFSRGVILFFRFFFRFVRWLFLDFR